MWDIRVNIGSVEGRSMSRGESYYRRWRREHPRLQVYLSREEYEWVRREAEKRGISISEFVKRAIINVMSLLTRNQESLLDELYPYILNRVIDEFIDNPASFYDYVVERAKDRGLESLEPFILTTPCSYCGKPVVLHHKLENAEDIRRALHETLRKLGIYHAECRGKTRGR